MTIGKLIWVSLFAVSLGCTHRSANVPSSAVKVDGFFIECSVESSAHANRCTIYNGDTGEVSSSGQFVISGSGREAQTADLRYAASDGSRIFLWDARILYPVLPRADKLMEGKLKLTAGNAAINCGVVPLRGDPNRSSDCALEAFSQHHAFYVYFINEGGTHPDSYGLAWDGSGNPTTIDEFDNSLHVYPCPTPVRLWKQRSWVSCTPSVE